ncbi:helix-turn-helix domain-containing protein [Clostridium sp. LP20]|uniref:helix-turn-helix domain-containing protein n=1 Tax=Clostridium sp. LP20 TaxID=3418665 RepID=UPI003EE5B93F
MENKFYTIDQIAEMLGMHHKTIRKFINEGKLGANKVGKQWRISGHDLSLFMEKNNVTRSSKSVKEESSIEYSATGGKGTLDNRVSVSTVVDINEIDKDEYMRISNMLLAMMNSNDSKIDKSTINMLYKEEENRLKVMLWGNVKFIEEMLNSISVLVEDRMGDV